MVFEHVQGAARAWANIAALLAPGGVAMAFHPRLGAASPMHGLSPEMAPDFD